MVADHRHDCRLANGQLGVFLACPFGNMPRKKSVRVNAYIAQKFIRQRTIRYNLVNGKSGCCDDELSVRAKKIRAALLVRQLRVHSTPLQYPEYRSFSEPSPREADLGIVGMPSYVWHKDNVHMTQ